VNKYLYGYDNYEKFTISNEKIRRTVLINNIYKFISNLPLILDQYKIENNIIVEENNKLKNKINDIHTIAYNNINENNEIKHKANKNE
jgi:hypothetical protein